MKIRLILAGLVLKLKRENGIYYVTKGTNAYIAGGGVDVGADIFRRGLCLPSDNKMTAEEQDNIIEIIRSCFA